MLYCIQIKTNYEMQWNRQYMKRTKSKQKKTCVYYLEYILFHNVMNEYKIKV